VAYTQCMSKRLQVVLSDEEMKSVELLAGSQNLSIGEFVRRSLREVSARRPTSSAEMKLAAVRQAATNSFPTADIEQMNREIAEGYNT
jgi:predicted transcriptional regulator